MRMTTSMPQRLIILYIMLKIIAFFIIKLVVRLYVRIGIFIHIWKAHPWEHHFTKGAYNYFISATFYQSVCTKPGKWSCICVLGVSILPLSTIYVFNFRIVRSVVFLFFVSLKHFFFFVYIYKLLVIPLLFLKND